MLKYPTLYQHLLFEQRKNYQLIDSDLFGLILELALIGKIISRETNKAGIAEILGFTGDINTHGDHVQKLDVFANNVFFNILSKTGRLAVMASEENEELIEIPADQPSGKYILAFDPLDGSSNIDVNVSVGSIFSIRRKISDDNWENLLQPGTSQVGAGYIIYGSSTMFVYTLGNGVHGFTLDPEIGEFLLSHEQIKLSDRVKNYSCNGRDFHTWDNNLQRYIEDIRQNGVSARYIGSLVADFHRNLLQGGIFMYPGNVKHPDGKLRLLYECAPMALIIEQAGGAASNGSKRILEIKPRDLHERTPLFIGNKSEVDRIEKELG